MNFKLPFYVLIMCYMVSPSMGQVGASIGSPGVPVPNEDFKKIDGKMDQSTSLMPRPGPPIGLASRLNHLEAEFREKMEDLEAQTSKSIKDQNEKITKVMGWEQKLAHFLNQSVEVMRELKTKNKDQAKRIDQLEQKVAMLQNKSPTSSALTRGSNKEKMKNGASNNNGQVSKASTPPSSCQELALLDYYLDGLYLVKKKETKKIHTVFCQFSDENKVSEAVIGQVDVTTKTVYFYVQRNSTFRTFNSVIPFELALLNEGNAFNLPSGIFTVPVPGIYHFDFSAVKDMSSIYLDIYLKLNGATVIGRAHTHQSAKGSRDVVSLSVSLRLAAGDRVNLYNNNQGVLFTPEEHFTQFTGWLVEEELM